MKTCIAGLAVCALASAAFGASLPVTGAAPISGGTYVVKRVVLEYDPASLTDKQAAAALLARIDQAAQTACSSTHQPVSEQMTARIDRCRTQAIADAVRNADSPELTAASAH